MPLTIRLLATLVLTLWCYLLAVAPASAPLWHPSGLDWVALVSFLGIAPCMVACLVMKDVK